MRVLLFAALSLLLMACEPRSEAKTPPNVETVAALEPTPTARVNQPLQITIDDTSYSDFKAMLQANTLVLYRGDDPNFEYELKLQFWTLGDELNNQSFRYPNPENQYEHAQMSYDKKNPDVNMSMVWLKEFEYQLSFGEEKDYKIPATISATIQAPSKMTVQGSIDVATAGIKMENGQIDRSYDHLDSIQWMTKDWIRTNKPHPKLTIADEADTCMMEQASKKPSKRAEQRQVAACSYLHSHDSTSLDITKLWFEKRDGLWEVAQQVPADQLLAANPIKPPRKNKAPYVYRAMAAQEFGRTLYVKEGGHRFISEPSSYPCGGGQREGDKGWCEITYRQYKKPRPLNAKVGGEEESSCQYVTYLFTQDEKENWQISQTLPSNKRYDRRTKSIIDRKNTSSWGC